MTTRRLNPVAWSEGMFLRPHHFQQADLFAEERLRYHLHAVDPFHWGVLEMEVDPEALSDHRFVLLRLEAILPGGVVVRHPGNAVVESREFDPRAERVDVHVGIHHLSATEANAAPKDAGVRRVRWLVDSYELPDVNRGGSDSPIEVAHPNVRVFLPGEEAELELHEAMKVAEIVATGELKRPFALSPSFAPPLLALQAHAPLYEHVGKLVSQMAANVRVVVSQTATTAKIDHPKLWMRYTLARMTPVLRHLLSTGRTRPFDIYTALIETAGSLAAFKLVDAAELPRYDHTDPYRCFRELIDFIDLHLEGVAPDTAKLFKLKYEKEQYSTTELGTETVDPRNFFVLAIKAKMDSKDLVQLVVQHGAASSRSGATTLVMLRKTGLRLEHLQGAPVEIPTQAGFEYFKLEPHGPEWKKVREEFSFAIALSKLESAEVNLYVVPPAG
jgi:type VI secretion system protein ImpJ